MNQLFEFIGRDPDVIYIVLTGGLLLSVTLAAMFVKFEAESPARRLKRRISTLGGRYHGLPSVSSMPTVSVKRHKQDSSFASLDKLLKRAVPRPALLRERLAKTGFRLSIGEYALINVLIGTLTALASFYFFRYGIAVAMLKGLAVGVGLPHMAVSYLIKRRLAKFTHHFPEAIELIVRGLKSGLPVMESLKTVATEIPKPVGPEFAEISNSVRLGRTMEESMWLAAKRIDTPEFKFFVISLSVQKETGGNLAETLENLADILRRRRQMKLKIKALSSEARASAYIIGALPFIMFGIIYLMNASYVMELFNDPRGHFMLGAGFVSLGLGIGIMAKMVRFEI